jgi:hypothetical protein
MTQFDPHTLLGRFVFVDNIPGHDKKPRTREGFVQAVIETTPPTDTTPATHDLQISLHDGGTAIQNQIVTLPFNSKEWRLRFPP